MKAVWKKEKISNLFSFIGNNTLSRDSLATTGTVKNIHYGDVLIKFGAVLDLKSNDIPYIKDFILPTVNTKETLCDGDIVIADTAEDETVGKACEIQNSKSTPAVAGLHTICIRPKQGLFEPGFLGYFINSKCCHDTLLPFIQGAKVSSISKQAIREIHIVIPPLSEQRAIAQALSDVDSLIAALQALIAKKKDIREGALYNLLTGNTRIGASTKKWEYLPIKDCVTIETGSKNTQDNDERGLYPFFVRSQQIESINSYSYDCEAVLTAGDGVGTGKVFHYINGKFDAHQRVYVLYNFTKVIGKFFYYYFKYYFLSEVIKYTAKSTVDSVRKHMIADMLIPIPDIEEQKLIAATLSDMDTELEALQTKLAKYQQIKAGMMDDLLTGRVRLAQGDDA